MTQLEEATRARVWWPVILHWSARVLLATLFIWAGAVKLIDTAQFVKDISHYQLLPSSWEMPLAYFMPWLELFVGAGLITPWLFHGSRLLILLMLIFFTAALFSTIARGVDIQCGCFGKESMTAWAAIIKNSFLIVMTSLLFAN